MAIEKSITTREDDYSQWYLDVIREADLADYAPVKGCMVIKPNGYAIWEKIQRALDDKFKETGVQNAYFPMLIPESYFKREADHVEGFAPECAVVTHAGGKKLEENLFLRPTSETIIYEMFSRWIKSYRDLPLVLNQWANVIRWEKRTRLFMRTTEFLWQEGHTAHATFKEADARARQMHQVYADFAQDYMAMPVFMGTKSESEKFAGAQVTYTIEAMMQDGKALQSGTSHVLADNFTKAFNIKFLDKDGAEKSIRATSWGVSTRLIGGLIMLHSDDKGLVIPPKLASIQVVIIPVNSDENVLAKVKEMQTKFKAKGISVHIDERDLRPGEKFFDWEKKGIPVRVEIGPKDLEKGSVVIVRRDSGEKQFVAENEAASTVVGLLEAIQSDLYAKALKMRDERTKFVNNYEEFKVQIETGFAKAYWCEDAECEKQISEETKATTRCLPFDQPTETGKCIRCGKDAHKIAIFGRSY